MQILVFGAFVFQKYVYFLDFNVKKRLVHVRWYISDYKFWARSGYQDMLYHYPDLSGRFRNQLHRSVINRTLDDNDVISFTRQMLKSVMWSALHRLDLGSCMFLGQQRVQGAKIYQCTHS